MVVPGDYLNLIIHVQARAQPDSCKSYAHQRETTGSSSGSLQLCPFPKCELLLKESICSQRGAGSKYFRFRAALYGKENHFYQIR